MKKPNIAFWAYLGTALVLILLVCYIAFPAGDSQAVPTYSCWEEEISSEESSAVLQKDSSELKKEEGGSASNEESAPASKRNTPAGKVNLNTAGKEELCSLDGIGETLAGRIIEYRNKNGKFTSIEQLMEVSGIGEKRFAAVKDHITI